MYRKSMDGICAVAVNDRLIIIVRPSDGSATNFQNHPLTNLPALSVGQGLRKPWRKQGNASDTC